jgi:hypothetical protein
MVNSDNAGIADCKQRHPIKLALIHNMTTFKYFCKTVEQYDKGTSTEEFFGEENKLNGVCR